MTLSVPLPDELVHQAQEIAAREHVSVEAFLERILTQHLSGLQYLNGRAKRGSREKFLAALDSVPDVEPEEFDRL